MQSELGRITAVLGPTNTGKTHYAIERMLAHKSGVIGLPLRLLAREVYDRVVAVRGAGVVALVTGEERIVPQHTAYWVCTVEAMPDGLGCDFLAVDEIQLCADPERGHVFTNRLLKARGRLETLFLGSETMRGAIAALVPKAHFLRRERFSELAYTGARKLGRMHTRSAIVGFSVDNVYAIAELIRRQMGGAAVVMGALSPRTRNAQVAMYQEGEVDFLVATDAIGMGLNLDIRHVAFSATRKFDGRRMRDLFPHELAQIAGRAGRHTQDGTFGVTGEAAPLPPEMAEAIAGHHFAPVKKLQWRNDALNFARLDSLIASLEKGSDDPLLVRAREADDLMALRALSEQAEIRARASAPASVRLLWDVCRIPDFRGISHAEHAALLGRIFGFLHEKGRVAPDWFQRQINRIDRPEGDIDTLSKRLAYVRTWTYVAQRKGWIDDEIHWRAATRAVEDRLSDALHQALTQRFVDRRTSVLLRRLKQKEALVAELNDKGEVSVEGQFVGKLDGFRFRQDAEASADEARTLKQAAVAALAPEFHLRADRMYNAPDTELDFTEQGGLMWGEFAVGKLTAGSEPLKPQIEVFVDDEAGADVAQKVARRLQHFMDRKIAALFEPLLAMHNDEAMTGLARGFGYRLVEAMGIIARAEVQAEVKELDQDARAMLRRHGVRFGQYSIFLPALLKPAPTRLRLVLWSLSAGLDAFPESPPPGRVTIPVAPGASAQSYLLSGYLASGARAIRIDMLERLADMLRACDSRGGFEGNADMLSITGLSLEQFADLMGGLGYRAERGERPKVRLAAEPSAAPAGATDAPDTENKAASADDGAPAEAAVQAAQSEAEANADAGATPASADDSALAEATVQAAQSEADTDADAGATPASADDSALAEATVQAGQSEAEADADAGATPASADDSAPAEATAQAGQSEADTGADAGATPASADDSALAEATVQAAQSEADTGADAGATPAPADDSALAEATVQADQSEADTDADAGVTPAPADDSAPAEATVQAGQSEADTDADAGATPASADDSALAEAAVQAAQPEAEADADAGATPASADDSALAEAAVQADATDASDSETESVAALADDGAVPAKADTVPEVEIFFTFTWGGNRGARRDDRGGRPARGQEARKPKGKRPPRKAQQRDDKPKGARGGKPKPAAKERSIDPDNPFAAALMEFKDKL